MNNTLRKSTCLFPIIFSWIFTCAQGIAGVWNGTLHVQSNDLPIVFHIGRDSTGKLIASFDSPGQNAFGFPMREVIIKEDSVILMMAMQNGKYAGVLGQNKKTIEGTWFEGKTALPLAVIKTSDNATVKQQRRPQTSLAKIKNTTGASPDEEIRKAITLMNTKWTRFFSTFDPQPYLQKLQCKVLALNGSRDIQVIAAPNLAGFRTSLQKSHSPEYEVIELPGLNHLFQSCIRCSQAEFSELEETISPKALEIIDDWLLKNVE